MNETNKPLDTTVWITTLICLLPIFLGIYLYPELPANIAVHFDSSGTPNNFLPKSLTVFGLPIFFALINLTVHFKLNTDPKNKNASHVLKNITKWLIPLFTVILMPITFFLALGADLPISKIVTCLVGIIITIVGNYLPKCKRNYTLGIKLPWTLDDEDNWNKTHRFSGFVWVIGGIIFTINAFINSIVVVIVVISLLAVLPTLYSYLYYRKSLKTHSSKQ